jgi:hypothetical protein
VPLDLYIKNLMQIVQQLQAAGVQNILLVTPPPVNEAAPDAILPGEVSHIRCQLVQCETEVVVPGAARCNGQCRNMWPAAQSKLSCCTTLSVSATTCV